MLFEGIELNNTSGDPLPRNPEGIFLANFVNNTSESIELLPIIDDDGESQDIRMASVIKQELFYEFTGQDHFKLEHSFNTGSDFSFRFRIRRKPQGNLMLPCRILCTIFFTLVSSAGEKKRRQQSEAVTIQ